jgi:hypothetical protein
MILFCFVRLSTQINAQNGNMRRMYAYKSADLAIAAAMPGCADTYNRLNIDTSLQIIVGRFSKALLEKLGKVAFVLQPDDFYHFFYRRTGLHFQ